jgi:uncharacterized membrane protein
MTATHHEDHRGVGLARLLGWAGMGLGVPQLLAPGRVLRLAGVTPSPGSTSLVRLVGAREMGAAAALLTKPKQGAFLWARVAGDVMDLALLGRALRRGGNEARRLTPATIAVAGVTALDIVAGIRRTMAARNEGGGEATRARRAVTVNRPPSEVYAFWRNFEQLPRFMHHLESVRVDGNGRSHWVAKAPLGRTVEWDAEITEDVPGSRIAWQSTGDAAVANHGSVTFTEAPGGRATEVIVELEFHPPGGPVGAAVAKVLGEHPEQQVGDDLRRFKQIMETGEVVVSDASPEGSNVLDQVRQRDAQPGGGEDR